jgi:hypothetical protein
MIETKTCLVLGAGASAPYGLPTGTELRDLILVTRSVDGRATALKFPCRGHGRPFDRRTFDGPPARASQEAHDAWNNLLSTTTYAAGLKELDTFRDVFSRAKRLSIDKFLEHNLENFGDVGKLQIAIAILNCEDWSVLDKGWYAELFNQITPNRPGDLEEEMLSVVTFNYDRSFEMFFWDAFRSTFRLTSQENAAVFGRLNIVHVYGDLGGLAEVDYGDLEKASEAAKRINPIRPEAPATQEEISKRLTNAENICFIGFGFAPENMTLFKEIDFKKKRVIATSLGLSRNTITAAQKAFPGIQFFDMDAHQLLQERDIFQARGRKSESPAVATRILPAGLLHTRDPYRPNGPWAT